MTSSRSTARTGERFGRIDGLVANAQSFRPVTPLAEVSPSDVDLFLDTGPKGTLWLMQAVHPLEVPLAVDQKTGKNWLEAT